jgi:eukaryotic-like serine/threonine-protein kinase
VPAPSKFATPAGAVSCPKCGAQVPVAALTCNNCGSVLGSSDAETVVSPSDSAVPGTPTSVSSSSSPSSAATLESSRSPQPQAALSDLSSTAPDFGPRYRVECILGEGGMGTVYKAWDKELERTVALKLVRRDLTRDPNVSQRFKQELLLASKISHRNILRIHDLGDGPGDTRFISMAYVEGQDLSQLLRKEGKLPLPRALNIAHQFCAALDAAHAEGVVHRDLKPQNILIDQHDHIYVSDFGLAKSLESDLGMTQTGQFLGTPRYMSPEQAEIKPVDHRSDLYAFGLILCELVTGDLPFERAESTMQMMYQRVHKAPKDPKQLNPDLPEYLARIIQKCLERDVTLRYQSAREILADLDAGHAPELTHPSWVATATTAVLRRPRNVWLAVAAALVVLAIALAVWKELATHSAQPTATVPAAPQVSLAILPFRNASGEASLDWLGPSLADMLSTDVGQSAHLRTISPDRLHQVLTDLQITANVVIDPTMLRRIAEFTSADTVVWGQYAKFGDQIRIDATLQDLKHDRRVPMKIEVPNEKDVPGGVDRLADSIRRNLGMSGDVLKELQASSFQPASKSMAALRDYNEGVRLLRDGKSMDAQKQLEAATKEDPTFALAFSKLAQTYANLGYDSEAERSARKAVALSDNLPQAERYLIAAIHAQVANNYPEAIKAYETMAKASPDNADVQSALGRLYENTGDFAKANEAYQKLLKANPKDIAAIVSIGRIAIRRGNLQDSLDPLNRALSLSIQLGNDEERSTSLHSIGVAYRMLNKPEDALRNFQEALAIRRRTGEKRGIALSLNEMARVEVSLGKPKDALPHYQEALQVRREIGDKRGLGDTLLDLGNFYDDRGDHDQALKMYKEALQLERDIGNEGLQAICLNNIGAVYFEKSEYEDARTYYQQALQLREKANVPQDIVESVHNLAETLARMGQYDQAVTQYMRALELRRSMDDLRGTAIESYSIGTLFDYQGRFGAAINSKQDALKTFRDLKDRTFWMAEILGGYAEALTLAGRGQESPAYLDEALRLSRELKNDGMVAQTLDFEGDLAYYSGDVKSARSSYQSALPAAAHSKEPDKVLIAKADLARVDIAEGRAAVAIGNLRPLARQAEEQGFAYMAVECSIDLGEAMMQTRDYSHARAELERALLQADKLGLKPLSAKAHYVLATVLRQSGNPADAQEHYRNSTQLIDDMRKEPGAEKIVQRSDFKAMYDEAARWSQAAKVGG